MTATAAASADEERLRRLVQALVRSLPPESTRHQDLWGALFDEGLAWVHFPPGRGGLGMAPSLQLVVDTEMRRAGVPSPLARNPIGIGMAAPVLLAHGADQLQERLLRPLFTGEELWCQLFSEPGAGSDVASLATRAERDGAGWVLNGQKVWTTLAHEARWALLLARSDPEVPKHQGLTYFVLDMHQPGVDVRPLRQMTGDAEFNEVYMTGARVPDEHRLGGVGQGWSVAVTTLMNERATIGGLVAGRGSGPIAQAVHLCATSAWSDTSARERVMQLWVEAEVLRLTTARSRASRQAGTPGPEGSVSKLHQAELHKRIFECCMDLLGPEAAGFPRPDATDPQPPGPTSPQLGDDPDVVHGYLRSRAYSIEGGTSEIMRNILAERVLGLPGDPRVDKNVPWSAVPRG